MIAVRNNIASRIITRAVCKGDLLEQKWSDRQHIPEDSARSGTILNRILPAVSCLIGGHITTYPHQDLMQYLKCQLAAKCLYKSFPLTPLEGAPHWSTVLWWYLHNTTDAESIWATSLSNSLLWSPGLDQSGIPHWGPTYYSPGGFRHHLSKLYWSRLTGPQQHSNAETYAQPSRLASGKLPLRS